MCGFEVSPGSGLRPATARNCLPLITGSTQGRPQSPHLRDEDHDGHLQWCLRSVGCVSVPGTSKCLVLAVVRIMMVRPSSSHWGSD